MSLPPENIYIKINPKSFSISGVKAFVENIGNESFSNVSWSISVSGGLFDRVNVSDEGLIDFLDSGDSFEISTWGLKDFMSSFNFSELRSRLIRRFGKINVEIKVNSDGKTNIEFLDGFVFGRFLLLSLWKG
jgi:hypothetical protein